MSIEQHIIASCVGALTGALIGAAYGVRRIKRKQAAKRALASVIAADSTLSGHLAHIAPASCFEVESVRLEVIKKLEALNQDERELVLSGLSQSRPAGQKRYLTSLAIKS